jgi:prolipoprotein diacylglyceryl transferase
LSIPSPSSSVWHLGPVPLRAYALCIIAGIIVGMAIANRRWRARGGTADSLESVVVLAVPCGIVGARIYHVITDYQLYFGPGRHPVDALKIWNGGLGIWGAIALAAVGAYVVARRRRIVFPALLDAAAPGIIVAQAIGRLGNWFNSELFGRPTTLPWALEIAPQFRPAGYQQYATFHPTFLYELLWNLVVAVVLVVVDRMFRLGHGKVFTL